MLRKYTIYTAAVLTLVGLCILLITTTVMAAENPHKGSGFLKTTAACAGCHRTHTGAGANLLKNDSQLSLCLSCHNTGTGADTNVVYGVYQGDTQGVELAGLRGGGFSFARMDTAADGTAISPAAVTSNHSVGAGSIGNYPIVWGSGALNGDVDLGERLGTSLQCGDCHNPHGNDSYRLLRPDPTGSLFYDYATANVSVPLPVVAENYTIAYDTNYYRNMNDYDSDVLAWMSDWCGQCHTRYHVENADMRDDTDAVYTYRHWTNALGDDNGVVSECLACHVAHGTSAVMQGAADTQVKWPNNVTPEWQDSSENSRLLTIDNRGVCMQCHTDDITGN